MDTSTLRQTLSSTNPTPQSIQTSASTIMKYYDRHPSIAVTEWRNVLQSCRQTQLLPLLYVANEVLQTSKRNRGNKYLELFSPVLLSSLQLICERDRGVTEKVRRVAKIWGDRRVFSTRFVSELLVGLDGFRSGGGGTAVPANARSGGMSMAGTGSGGPQPNARNGTSSSSSPVSTMTPSQGIPKRKRHRSPVSEDDDDDDDRPFGDPDGPSLLQVNVTIDTHDIQPTTTTTPTPHPTNSASTTKRKRTTTTPSQQPPKERYKTSTLHDLISRTEELDMEFHTSKQAIDAVNPTLFTVDDGDLQNVFGDELNRLNDSVRNAERVIRKERMRMRDIASEKYELERNAANLIPVLRDSLKQDDEEVVFCERMERKLDLFAVVVDVARIARARKIEEELQKQRQCEEERQRKQIEDERRKALEMAMKENVPEPGMVWNKVAREYQHINDHTDEDWRN